MKKGLLFLLITMLLVLSACETSMDDENNDEKTNDKVANDTTDLLQLTIEELAMYDGKNGADAYIAVDDVIYDVTGVSAWTGGSHNGNMAGTDVSSVIGSAPHGDSVLDDLDIIGEIVQ